jgi:hypothetical protein
MKNLLITAIIALALIFALTISLHKSERKKQAAAYAHTNDSLQTIIRHHQNTISLQETTIATNQTHANRLQRYGDSLLKQVNLLQHQLHLAHNAIDTMPDSAQVAMFNRFTNPAPAPAILLSYQSGPAFVSTPIHRIQNANRIFITQYFQEQQIQHLQASIISKDSAYTHITILSAAKDTVIFTKDQIIFLTGQQLTNCENQRQADKKENRWKIIKSSALTAAITTAIILLIKSK